MKEYLTRTHQKSLTKLRMKKYRDAQGLFLISGLRAVSGTLEYSSPGDICEILIREDQEDLLDKAPFNRFKKTPVFICDEQSFRSISDEQHAQGIALVLRKPARTSLPDTRPVGAAYYLHEVNDPGNLGTIIRSAAWFNVRDILLSPGSVDPYSPKCVRATAGAILKVRIWEDITLDYLSAVQERGCQLYVTDVQAGQPISALKTAASSLILMGSEAHGLPAEIRALETQTLHIPGAGSGESLNLATATAIIMYHFHLQENS